MVELGGKIPEFNMHDVNRFAYPTGKRRGALFPLPDPGPVEAWPAKTLSRPVKQRIQRRRHRQQERRDAYRALNFLSGEGEELFSKEPPNAVQEQAMKTLDLSLREDFA